MANSDNNDIERLARRRAKAKLGWFIHAAVYLTVNLTLAVLSFGRGHTWAVYPALGWGLGLLLHGLSVWAFAPGGGMLERMVEHERAKLARTLGDRN
jgi:hypothetical protein